MIESLLKEMELKEYVEMENGAVTVGHKALTRLDNFKAGLTAK